MASASGSVAIERDGENYLASIRSGGTGSRSLIALCRRHGAVDGDWCPRYPVQVSEVQIRRMSRDAHRGESHRVDSISAATLPLAIAVLAHTKALS